MTMILILIFWYLINFKLNFENFNHKIHHSIHYLNLNQSLAIASSKYILIFIYSIHF